MSTRVGTLQGSQTGRSIWPAAILASLVMLTIAIAAVSLGRDQVRPRQVPQDTQTVVSGTAANTPSELSGGIVGGTPAEGIGAATSGITAGSSSIAIGARPDRQAAIAAAQNAADANVGGATTQDEPIMVNGHICGQCG